jgi:hypothetical protein
VSVDFQVGESVDGFDGAGVAAQCALGALKALEGAANMSAFDKIKAALMASTHFSTGSRLPFVIMGTGKLGRGELRSK